MISLKKKYRRKLLIGFVGLVGFGVLGTYNSVNNTSIFARADVEELSEAPKEPVAVVAQEVSAEMGSVTDGALQANEATIYSYTVQTGDTMYSVSKLFGVSLDDLRRVNSNIVGDAIMVGEELIIPNGQVVQAN